MVGGQGVHETAFCCCLKPRVIRGWLHLERSVLGRTTWLISWLKYFHRHPSNIPSLLALPIRSCFRAKSDLKAGAGALHQLSRKHHDDACLFLLRWFALSLPFAPASCSYTQKKVLASSYHLSPNNTIPAPQPPHSLPCPIAQLLRISFV